MRCFLQTGCTSKFAPAAYAETTFYDMNDALLRRSKSFVENPTHKHRVPAEHHPALQIYPGGLFRLSQTPIQHGYTNQNASKLSSSGALKYLSAWCYKAFVP
jgi:hypothetical protein